MKRLVILSGKGGTGKTTVAASLGYLASQSISLVLADADVDAANLELVLAPEKAETHNFSGGKEAFIDPELCGACGICADVCRFDAIIEGPKAYQVDSLACEGCAACFYQCPNQAIAMVDEDDGQWFRSETKYGSLFHAHLFAGRENSGKLVTLVKEQAIKCAEDNTADLVLVDGPPGIGCPVIAASTGMDLALHVVEPTISGVHDLERILATTDHFGIPSIVAINKADINERRSNEIASYCSERDIQVVGRIPYDNVVTEAMVKGMAVAAYQNGAIADELGKIWKNIDRILFNHR